MAGLMNNDIKIEPVNCCHLEALIFSPNCPYTALYEKISLAIGALFKSGPVNSDRVIEFVRDKGVFTNGVHLARLFDELSKVRYDERERVLDLATPLAKGLKSIFSRMMLLRKIGKLELDKREEVCQYTTLFVHHLAYERASTIDTISWLGSDRARICELTKSFLEKFQSRHGFCASDHRIIMKTLKEMEEDERKTACFADVETEKSFKNPRSRAKAIERMLTDEAYVRQAKVIINIKKLVRERELDPIGEPFRKKCRISEESDSDDDAMHP